MNIRPCIITATYYPNLNGVSISSYRLTENLRKKGYKSFVITSKIQGAKYPKYVMAMPSFPMPKHISPDMKIPYVSLMQIYRFIVENKINVLLSTDPFITASIGRFFSSMMGIPHIYIFHTHFEAYSYFNIPGHKKIIRSIVKNVGNHVDLNVILSTKILKYIRDIGVTNNVSQLINIPHTSHLSPQRKNPALMKKYGIMSKDFVFTTFGRVNKEKGIDISIEVLAPLIKKNKHIKYMICGFGPEIENLQQLSKKLKIQDNVICTGKYEQHEVLGLANLGDCFLFTSTTDNQPISILEAMTCGLPVISINDDSVDYILIDGYNGVKCQRSKLTTFCQKMVTDAMWKKKLSQNARKSALKMSEEAVTKSWITMLEKTVTEYTQKKGQDLSMSTLMLKKIKKMLKPSSSLKKLSVQGKKIIKKIKKRIT